MKNIITVLFFNLALSIGLSAQTRVVCVGNSITAGSGASDAAHSYPSQLANLLGSNYTVLNCGVPGRTMLRKGDHPYMNETKYTDALNFNPDIVIIGLGTNDSKPYNWVYKADFFSDYKYMIEQFRLNGKKPHIFACSPPPSFTDNFYIVNSTIHDEVIPLVDSICAVMGTSKIEYYHNMLSWGSNFADGIHPNDAGALKMAQIAFKTISDTISVTSITSPLSNYSLTDKEQITITINNNLPTQQVNVPVAYRVDDSNEVKEIISTIPANCQIKYKFTQKADLSQFKDYKISAYTVLNNQVKNDTVFEKVINFRPSSDLALQFFGNNGKITIPHDESLMPTTALTVDAWICPTYFKPTSSDETIISKEQTAANNRGYALTIGGNGQGRFLVCDGELKEAISPVGAIILNKWQHIAGVYDGTTVKLYIDGALQSTVICNKILPSTGDLVIGQTAIELVDRAFIGAIDEIRVWNRSLTVNQINETKNNQLWGNESGLVAYYKLNEGFGSTVANDSTGTEKNGSIHNVDPNKIWVAGAGLLPKVGSSPKDVAMVSIISPKTKVGLSNNEQIVIKVYNYNNSLVSNVPVSYKIDDNNVVNEIIPLIPARSNLIYTFSNKADLSQAKIYHITTFTSLYGDENIQNDSCSKVVVNFALGNDFALLFSGTSGESVSVPHSSILIPTTAFTIQAWVYPTQFRKYIYEGTVLSKQSANGGYALIVGGDGQGRFVIGTSKWIIADLPAKSITLNKWTHIAGVYDGSTLKFYVDGVLKTTTINTAKIIASTSNLLIGASPVYTGREYIGGIDEVSVWNKALSENEILKYKDYLLKGNEAGLVAYYRLNEGIGSSIISDSTSNKNNGTLLNLDIDNCWISGVGLPAKQYTDVHSLSTQSSITINPNIANGNLFVKVDRVEIGMILEMRDVMGRINFYQNLNNEGSEVKINVSNFAKGIYFLSLKGNAHSTTVKVIIR